jgi:hypothetical protein
MTKLDSQEGGGLGWRYEVTTFDRQQLSEAKSLSWEPQEISSDEWIILMEVSRTGELDNRDTAFRLAVTKKGT